MMLLFSAERTEDWREEGLESQSHIARGMAGKIKNESMDALVGGTLNSLSSRLRRVEQASDQAPTGRGQERRLKRLSL